MSTDRMPRVNLAAVEMTAAEREIAERIVNAGRLRASKPKVIYSKAVVPCKYSPSGTKEIAQPDEIGGKAAYLWRMVAFTISPDSKHHCMPTTADFDLPERDYAKRREMAKTLDGLADRIIASVPKAEHHGTRRWARALGYVR